MAPTVVNAGPIQPIVGQEVLVATLAGGPFDDVDVYIAGGTSTTGGPSPELIFRLYQTIGGTSYLVEEAGYAANGANGALLSWPQPIGSSLPGKPGQTTHTVHAG